MWLLSKKNTRDASRKANVSVLSEALEKYYVDNGEYPSCASLSQDPDTVSESILSGMDTGALSMPESPDDNALRCGELSELNGDYIAFVGDGTTECLSGNACTTYELQYRQEATGSIKSEVARHETVELSVPAPVVTVLATGYDSLSVSWTAVAAARQNYEVQYATDSSFTSSISSTIAPTSTDYSGLSYDTEYYVRVRVTSAVGVGPWSGVINSSTWSIGVPGSIATSNPATSSLDVSWSTAARATGYVVEYANNSGFSSPNSVTSTSSPVTLTGLSQGQRYYVRVKGTDGSYSGDASGGSIYGTTTISTPTMTSATTSNPTNADTTRWSWTAANCAAGTTNYYSMRIQKDDGLGYGSWSTEQTATTIDYSTIYQGYQYTVQLRVRCGTAYAVSSYSSVVTGSSYIRAVDTPGAATSFVKQTVIIVSYVQTSVAWTEPTCGPGTTQRHRLFGVATAGSGGAVSAILLPLSQTAAQQMSMWKTAFSIASDVAWSSDSQLTISGYTSPYYNNTGPVDPYGTSYSSPYSAGPSTDPVSGAQLRVMVYYACKNDTTRRHSTWGPVARSSVFTW